MNRLFAIALLFSTIVLPQRLPAQALISNTMPVIESVGTGSISRTSATKDSAGRFLPPWTKVEVVNIFGFKKQPRMGKPVTFVPIDMDIEAFELNTVGSTAQDGCSKSSPKWWSPAIQPVYDRRLFDATALSGRAAETPFDVIAIYPAVAAARQIPKDQLRADMLPTGVKPAIVKAAVDVTGDGSPDLVVTEYCCSNGAAGAECDMSCGAIYKRSGKRWLKIDTSQPC